MKQKTSFRVLIHPYKYYKTLNLLLNIQQTDLAENEYGKLLGQ